MNTYKYWKVMINKTGKELHQVAYIRRNRMKQERKCQGDHQETVFNNGFFKTETNSPREVMKELLLRSKTR